MAIAPVRLQVEMSAAERRPLEGAHRLHTLSPGMFAVLLHQVGWRGWGRHYVWEAAGGQLTLLHHKHMSLCFAPALFAHLLDRSPQQRGVFWKVRTESTAFLLDNMQCTGIRLGEGVAAATASGRQRVGTSLLCHHKLLRL